MSHKCILCSLEFKNDEQYKQHLEGKKHKKIESIKQDREKNANRSLFVSGLKKDTFIKHLEDHFLQFGKINKIIIDQEKNAYAIVEYEFEESVEKALHFTGEHRVNDKNLKISRRQLKEFISKLTNNTDKKKEVLDKIKEEALVVNKKLGKCESLDDQIATLIEYLKLDEKSFEQRKQICEGLNKLFRTYWNDDEFKLSIFGSTSYGLAVNGSDMDMTVLFANYLPANQFKQQITSNIKNKATLKCGNDNQDSSGSNLGELEEDINLDDDLENGNAENSQTLKESIKKFFNELNYKEISSFELDHQVKILARIVQRLDGIKHLKTITNTRCPVVRFFHEKTSIYCDISLNNYLAVANSKLFEVYMALEPNLQKLIFTIRYWMKHKNLSSPSRFNSYTITWLIIFYMQQKKIGYLPIVQDLIKMADHKNEIHGWNCGFETNLEKILSNKPSDPNHSSININNLNDLIKGFFDFYSSFKFNLREGVNQTISTQTAQCLLTETELSKVTSVLNIQDPFDLSHNLTANITKNTLDRFVSDCKGSNELLEYSKQPHKSDTKCWGLMLLMTKKILPIVSSSKICLSAKDLVERSKLKLKVFDENMKSDAEKEQGSIKKSIDFVMFILKECLMFDELSGAEMIAKKRKRFKALNQICDQVDSLGLSGSPKRLKTANNNPNAPSSTYACVIDDNLNNNDQGINNESIIATHQFRIKNNTWQGRRALKRSLKQKENTNEKLDNLSIEKLVSQKLIDSSQTNMKEDSSKKTCFSVVFYMDENDSKENMSSNLKMKFDLLEEADVQNDQNDLINFMTLVHFLDVYINNCHEKIFNSWMSQPSGEVQMC